MTFAVFAHDWLENYPSGKGLKKSTQEGYASIVARHLEPALGNLSLDAIALSHLERYVSDKRRAGLAPRRGDGAALAAAARGGDDLAGVAQARRVEGRAHAPHRAEVFVVEDEREVILLV